MRRLFAALALICASTFNPALAQGNPPPEVVAQLLASPGDISLVVDRCWADAYDGREDHPVGEAELAEVNGEGLITEVGKHVVCHFPRFPSVFIGIPQISLILWDANEFMSIEGT